MSDEAIQEAEAMRGRRGRPAQDAGEVAELRAAVAALQEQLQALQKPVPGQVMPMMQSPVTENPLRWYQQKFKSKMDALEAERSKTREDLARGPRKFVVYHNMYPQERYREIIGGSSEGEAVDKFKKLNHITGFLDQRCRIVAEPYQEVAAA